eukprot:gnl/Trimastix_PCT/352.p1 GENE.gnl/Trimastix_PCT/352~~gnl/Trimastix_PCT/352.p1  ORF type:complete len:341 (+),score=92.09 gnl/Trimastix_PCT/352:302-1324(+)
MQHGQVSDWDLMEKYWQQCIFKYLRCEPENHYFLLTESPLNTPENREYTAEIMFETFNVSGLYIAVQAVLALTASNVLSQQNALTGTVIDSGDGVTHVIPVSDGYTIPSQIQHIPVAGREVTHFIMDFMKERETTIPSQAGEPLEVARLVKENYGYVCRDIVKEFDKYDKKPQDFIKQHNGQHPVNRSPYTCDIGYERFLGPEIFFSPEIFSSQYLTPLPQLVDQTIRGCPVDTRRGLYKNICLSGGTTMFRNFGRRMQEEIQKIVNKRHDANERMTGVKPTPIEVKVRNHNVQHYAVWLGGSILAGQPQFQQMVHTKAQYDEYGPSICRHNAAFSSLTS